MHTNTYNCDADWLCINRAAADMKPQTDTVQTTVVSERIQYATAMYDVILNTISKAKLIYDM